MPTVAESGYPGYQMSSWIVLVGAARLAAGGQAEARAGPGRLHGGRRDARKLKGVGFEPAYAPIKDWSGMVGKDIARLRKIAEQSQIKPD